MISFFLATYRKSKGCDKGNKDISEFHMNQSLYD